MRNDTYPILVIVTIVIVNLLSFYVVGSMEHSTIHPCPFAFLIDGICPPTDNIFAGYIHHTSGLKELFKAAFNQNLVLVIAGIFAVFCLWLFTLKDYLLAAIPIISRNSRYFDNLHKKSIEIFKWLALHNKRDPYLNIRAHALT